MSSEITVILPTLNEAGNLPELTRRIWEAIPNCRITVVDDGSTDGTPDVVTAMVREKKNIELVARTFKPCLTDSIQEGIQRAQTPYVCWMDADLSHPPEYLPNLLQLATNSGCAIASRFAKGGSHKKNTKDTPDSFFAAVLSWIMNMLAKYWLRLKVTDYTSGYIVVRRDLLEKHPLQGDYGEYFIELVHFLTYQGVEIEEIPYECVPRQWGESKTGVTLIKLATRGIKYLWIAFKLGLPGRLPARQKSTAPYQSPSSSL